MSSKINPPLDISWCEYGHYWVRINPYWSHKLGTSHRVAPKWCPVHLSQGRSKTLSEARRNSVVAYAALPLPKTKRCSDSKCPHGNSPQPAENFYIKKLKVKSSEAPHLSLYSYCKECSRRRTQEGTNALSKEEKRKRAKKHGEHYRKTHKEKIVADRVAYKKKEKERRKKVKKDRERTIWLPVTDDFKEWVKKKRIGNLNGMPTGTLTHINDTQYINLNTADKIMLASDGSLEDFWTEEELKNGAKKHL